MAVQQTAGHDLLGDLAPKFAELNNDVLFGEVWSREDKLSLHDRSMITIACFMTKGDWDNLIAHMKMGKKNGITKEEIVEEITNLSFYAGCPMLGTPSTSSKKFGIN